jgi:hypothetical protein
MQNSASASNQMRRELTVEQQGIIQGHLMPLMTQDEKKVEVHNHIYGGGTSSESSSMFSLSNAVTAIAFCVIAYSMATDKSVPQIYRDAVASATASEIPEQAKPIIDKANEIIKAVGERVKKDGE